MDQTGTRMGDVAAVFQKRFSVEKAVEKATITMTAMGIYEPTLNGRRISDYVLAPGWTTYKSRLQYQQYDITEYLMEENELLVTVGKGWYRSPLLGTNREELQTIPCGMIAQIALVYIDGSSETIVTDEAWGVLESEIRFSEIYDGEICDARFTPSIEEGRPMPIDVYDAATWMAISVLTEVSIQKGSMLVEIPDFTNGRWLL